MDSCALSDKFILEAKSSNKRPRVDKDEARFVASVSYLTSSKKERLLQKKPREYRFITNTSRTPSLHVDDYVNKEKQTLVKGKPKMRWGDKRRDWREMILSAMRTLTTRLADCLGRSSETPQIEGEAENLVD